MGLQYERACTAVTELSTQVFEASETLNDVQRQVIVFEQRVHDYEEDGQNAPAPSRHNVRRVQVEVNTALVQLNTQDMSFVSGALYNYLTNMSEECRKLCMNRDSIGEIWQDPQFKRFSEYIDEICLVISRGCRELNSYRNHLNVQIRNLESN